MWLEASVGRQAPAMVMVRQLSPISAAETLTRSGARMALASIGRLTWTTCRRRSRTLQACPCRGKSTCFLYWFAFVVAAVYSRTDVAAAFALNCSTHPEGSQQDPRRGTAHS